MKGLHVELNKEDSSVFQKSVDSCVRKHLAISLNNNNRKEIFDLVSQNPVAIPLSISSALEKISAHNSTIPYLLISGLSMKEPKGNVKKNYESEIILSCISLRLGKPFVPDGHREGDIFLDLVPRKEDAGKELGTGTELDWHTEDAHLALPARFICLLGLRGDREAKTMISMPDCKNLSQEVINFFKQQIFVVNSDESYSAKESISQTIMQTINDVPELRFDPKFTEYRVAQDKEIILQFKKILEANKEEFCVMNGDLLIFNNRLAAHKRSTFTPAYDGTDRWVQRIMVI